MLNRDVVDSQRCGLRDGSRDTALPLRLRGPRLLFAAARRIEEDAGVATRGVAEAAIEDGILGDAEEQLGEDALAAQATGHELDAESALELAASVVRSVTSR